MAIQWFENAELPQGDEQGTEWETMNPWIRLGELN
jgi:hypothetical protein